MDLSEISGDIYYVKAMYKEKFLETTEKVKMEWSGQYAWSKFPKFLGYRKCDFSGEEFSPDDQVFCVYVIKLK
jgi:hypothetical protein